MTEEILHMDVAKVKTPGKSILCPKCKQGDFIVYPKVVKCNHPACNHIIYRKKNEVILSDKQLSSLFEKGTTGIIKGFKNKLGKPFDASLILDGDCNLKFDFSDVNKKSDAKRKKK